jgi:hypothetical protein
MVIHCKDTPYCRMCAMKMAGLLFLAMATLISTDSSGQISAAPTVYQPADRQAEAALAAPGPPNNPPIFSQMTVIWQSKLEYEDKVNLKGPVASVERRNEQQPAQNPDPSRIKETLKFDESGHLVERINEAFNCLTTETLVWEGNRRQNQKTTHHCDHSRNPDGTAFNEWTYNKDGRVSGFQSGQDKVAYTDLVNFKYNASGRLSGYELLARNVVQFSYVGNRITQSTFPKGQHQKIYEQSQTVDAKGRVIDLKVSDMTGGKLTPWYHVAFKYDNKDRVVEQQTDPFKLGSGDDYSPLPGKLIVEYDDEKQTGEQKFYDTDGKLALHTKFQCDRDGVFTKLLVIDALGKERVGGETFVDAQHKSSTRPGSVEWEVIYDDHGNWTERRRWFTPADESPKIMTRLVRQTITYR